MNMFQNLNKMFGVALLSWVVFSNCSKDKKDEPSSGDQKIVFKVESSANSPINMVVFGFDGTLTTVSAVNSESWTSAEMTAPGTAHVATVSANARGAGSSSTLKVEIYVNGMLKKEATSNGTALSATAQHHLR